MFCVCRPFVGIGSTFVNVIIAVESVPDEGGGGVDAGAGSGAGQTVRPPPLQSKGADVPPR